MKWLVYGVVITAVNEHSPGARVLGPALGAAPLQGLELLGVFFSFVAAFAVPFVFEISQIVGPRNLRNIVLGSGRPPFTASWTACSAKPRIRSVTMAAKSTSTLATRWS